MGKICINKPALQWFVEQREFTKGSHKFSTGPQLSESLNVDQRRHLLRAVSDIIPDIASLSDEDLTRSLLCGDNTLKRNINHSILSATITYIGSTKRFNKLEAFNEV